MGSSFHPKKLSPKISCTEAFRLRNMFAASIKNYLNEHLYLPFFKVYTTIKNGSFGSIVVQTGWRTYPPLNYVN
jgi:hypothetical protein